MSSLKFSHRGGKSDTTADGEARHFEKRTGEGQVLKSAKVPRPDKKTDQFRTFVYKKIVGVWRGGENGLQGARK